MEEQVFREVIEIYNNRKKPTGETEQNIYKELIIVEF
jgi:hypothetical protein